MKRGEKNMEMVIINSEQENETAEDLQIRTNEWLLNNHEWFADREEMVSVLEGVDGEVQRTHFAICLPVSRGLHYGDICPEEAEQSGLENENGIWSYFFLPGWNPRFDDVIETQEYRDAVARIAVQWKQMFEKIYPKKRQEKEGEK